MNWQEIKEANKDIKTVDVHGNSYALAAQRVKAFRNLCPRGKITTEVISFKEDSILIKATVSDETGEVLSTGLAYETKDSSPINRTSFVENCETSAIGRALGFLGLGIDASICSAEELVIAIAGQQEDPKAEFVKNAKKPLYIPKDMISPEVFNRMRDNNLTLDKVRTWAINEKLTYRNLNDEIVEKAIMIKQSEDEGMPF